MIKRIKKALKSNRTTMVASMASILVATAVATPSCWLSFLGQPKMPEHLVKRD